MSGSQQTFSIGSSGATAITLRLTGTTINSANNVILRNSGTGTLSLVPTTSSTGPMALDLGNATDNVILIDNSGSIVISATVTGASRTLTLSGSGAGSLTLSAANTYTGTTQLSAGTLRAGNDGAFGTSLLLLNGGTLSSDGATARSFANATALRGDVAFGDVTGTTGALTFGGAIGLGGGTPMVTTTVSTTFAGAITDGSLTKAGAATLALTNSGNSFGTLTVNAGTVSIRADTTVTALAGSSGALQLAAGTLTVNQAAGGTTALPFTGSGGFTKAGTSLLSLTGASGGYAGTTTVAAGTLAANGVLGGSVSVSSGATLAGSGTVGSVTVTTGATLAPGNSPGVLTTGDITWAGGGNYNWQLYDAALGAGTGWDLVASGALTITAGATNRFAVNLWSLAGLPNTNGTARNFSFTTSGTYTIGTFSSVSGAVGDWYTINTAATNGTGGFAGYNPALGGFSLVSTGTSIDLVYTHTPLALYSYVGGAGTWSDMAGWSLGDSPEGDAAISFDGPGGITTNDLVSGTGANELTSVKSLAFNNAAGAYTVAGNTLSLGLGGIVNDSANGQAISANVTLGSPASFAANTADLTFSGTVDTAGNSLAITGAAATTLGVVAGTGSLVQAGSGTTTLTGAVAPSVAVAAGRLLLGGPNLLADSGTVTVSGGTLDLQSNSDTIGTFSITAGTLAGSGTLTAATYALGGGTVAANLGPGIATATSGSTSLAGTLAGNLTVAGGALGLAAADRIGNTSAVTVSSGTLALGSFSDTAGSFTITGGVLGGSGTLTAATYALGGGTVAANLGAGTATASSGSTSLAGTLAGGLTVAGGTVTLGSAGRLAAGSTVTLAGGSLVLGGNETVAAFSQSGGSVGGTGRITAGTYTLTGGSASVGFAGSGAVTANSGATTLAGDSAGFTGGTTIGGGALTLTSGNALGSGAVILSAGSLRAANGQTIANTITIGGTGGAVLYAQNFNALGSGLPMGWTTGTGATASSVGTSVASNTAQVLWSTNTGQFANYASATGLSGTSTTAAQNASTDRALGVRQTGTFGDPGAAFNYAFSTTGQVIDSVSLDLMLLSVQGYSTTWSIQYGAGTSPSSFTTLGTWTDPGTWGTTSLTWSGAAVSGMSNLAAGVFRVVALSQATGANSRDSIGIDNFSMSLKSRAAATLGAADASAVTYSGPIAVAGTATLTAGAGGTATFSGGISGAQGSVTKTGAGVVALSGSNSFAGTTTVSEGTLTVLAGGRLAGTSGVTVGSGATLRALGEIGTSGSSTPVTVNGILSGNGRVFGTVGGSGSIDPGNSPGILTATQVDPSGGLDHDFEFTALAAVYTTTGTGVLNDILHLTGTTPFTAALSGTAGNAVNVYFNDGSFAEGRTYTGGFFVDTSPSLEVFLANVSGAQFNFFVADIFGGITYQGVAYRSLSDWNAAHAQAVRIEVGAIAVAGADFSTGTTSGYVTRFAAVPEPSALALAGSGLAAARALRRRSASCRARS